jgi:hypothetical protein
LKAVPRVSAALIRKILAAGFLFLLAAAAPRAAAQPPIPGTGSSGKVRQSVEPRRDPRSTLPLPVFEFHSGFWLNLHHVLYEQARRETGRITHRPASAAVPPAAAAQLSPEEAAEWKAAVDLYTAEMAPRDLVFDGDMVNIKTRLAELEDCKDLSGRAARECTSGIRADVVAALERAAPVYRARQWEAHDRANREWIAALAPLVQESGAGVAALLSGIYHADWPASRIRVEVSAYAGPLGGYASLEPLHLIISGEDGRNRQAAALEWLFALASSILATSVRDLISAECRARSKPIPRELWSALLLYTAADALRRPPGSLLRQLPAGGPAQQLAARNWQNFRALLELYWRPYLNRLARNEADPDEMQRAIARLVGGL